MRSVYPINTDTHVVYVDIKRTPEMTTRSMAVVVEGEVDRSFPADAVVKSTHEVPEEQTPSLWPEFNRHFPMMLSPIGHLAVAVEQSSMINRTTDLKWQQFTYDLSTCEELQYYEPSPITPSAQKQRLQRKVKRKMWEEPWTFVGSLILIPARSDTDEDSVIWLGVQQVVNETSKRCLGYFYDRSVALRCISIPYVQ